MVLPALMSDKVVRHLVKSLMEIVRAVLVVDLVLAVQFTILRSAWRF